MDIPTPWFQFDATADIEPTDDGFAVVQDGKRVDLSDTLVHRLTIRVLSGQRRTAADA